MEEEEEMPPFWLQQTNRGGRRGSGSPVSSTFLNSALFLILAVLAIVSVLVFIVIPSIVDFTSQILKPHSVKKSWDSLNLVLVLFAIVCGFLSRNTIQNNSSSSSSNNSSYNVVQHREDRQKSNPTTPGRWSHEYGEDRIGYNTGGSSSTSSLSRLRSFRSYPDLRQESIWEGSSDERWRFYDDTHLRNYDQVPDPDQLYRGFRQDRPRQQLDQDRATEAVLIETKDIAVDTYATNPEEVKDPYFSPPPSPRPPKSTPLPPPPPPPPPPATELEKAGKRKVKRAYHDPGSEKRAPRKEVQVPIFTPPATEPEKDRKRNVKRVYHDPGNEERAPRKEVQVPVFPPPPPPPPAPVIFGKSDKKRGKDILNSIRGKKRKPRQKSVDNFDAFFDPLRLSSSSSTSVSFLPPPSPPPPPPPPPPPFFQNIFSSKKSKAKKTTLKVPPPPPPPPATTSSRRIPAPEKTTRSRRIEESFGSGGASPLRPIPPPPPPPPFKMPAWKFVVEGDYVRVGSFGSSRSGSPDLDSQDDVSSDRDSPVADAGIPATALFCPSPDVNTKADNFIARFRAGLNLEKVNSVKGRSNLGPSPGDIGDYGPS